MNYVVHSQKKHSVTIDRKVESGKSLEIIVDKNHYTVGIRKVDEEGKIQTLMVDHRVVPVEVERRGDGMPVKVYLKGIPYDVDISKMASTRFRPPLPEREISGDVCASLPGQVVRMMVKVGDTVSAGDSLFILDAMKMENEIISPKAGTVETLIVDVGQIVAKGDLILQIGD